MLYLHYSHKKSTLIAQYRELTNHTRLMYIYLCVYVRVWILLYWIHRTIQNLITQYWQNSALNMYFTSMEQHMKYQRMNKCQINVNYTSDLRSVKTWNMQGSFWDPTVFLAQQRTHECSSLIFVKVKNDAMLVCFLSDEIGCSSPGKNYGFNTI